MRALWREKLKLYNNQSCITDLPLSASAECTSLATLSATILDCGVNFTFFSSVGF